MPQSQLLMVAGFVMLGWVLARRQIRGRRRAEQETRLANKAIEEMRRHRQPSLPLGEAPVETQRWQVAMFDLQRELKGELDTRIAIVQALIREMDTRIERAGRMMEPNQASSSSGEASSGTAIDPQQAAVRPLPKPAPRRST